MPSKDDGLGMGAVKPLHIAETDIQADGSDTLAAAFGPALNRPPGKPFGRLDDLTAAFPQFQGEPAVDTLEFDDSGKMEISFT